MNPGPLSGGESLAPVQFHYGNALLALNAGNIC